MSLILEALNKAEENQNTSACYSAPQVYPHQEKAHTKRVFLLLIVIACLTSAIVALFIFTKLNASNETAQLESQNTEYSTSTTPTSQQADHEQDIEHPSDKQPASPVINRKTLATPASRNIKPSKNKSVLEESNSTNYREPSLHRLVKSTAQHEKSEPAQNKQKILNTIGDNKKENDTNTKTATKSATTGSSSKVYRTDDAPQISGISTASNLEMADLKVSVHMYSETPAKRFVYINSTRYSEGSRINNDLFIDEITENGIILNSHNTLYRLPLKP